MSVLVGERPAPVTSAAPGPRPAPLRAHPTAILTMILAGAVATIGLWWHNTPSVSGWGDWLTNAGRVTGLLAGYGVVVLVALMARIPPVERGVSADRLARWHAMGGRYVASLVVAHGLLITWGYAVSAHASVLGQTKTLLMSYPDVLMATVAGLLLVGVGITSARASSERDVVFRQELEKLAARRSATVRFLVGRRSDLGWDPLSATALATNMPDLADHDVYLCGPPGMTAGVRAALAAAGVPRRQVHSESFEF